LEPKLSLPCSQNPATGSYTEPGESSPIDDTHSEWPSTVTCVEIQEQISVSGKTKESELMKPQLK